MLVVVCALAVVALAAGDSRPAVSPAIWTAPPLNPAQLIHDDAARVASTGGPFRVALPVEAGVSLTRSGRPERAADGTRRVRLELRSPGALWLVPVLGGVRLEGGSRLEVRAPSGALLAGPFHATDVAEGSLRLPPIEGDALVFELVRGEQAAEAPDARVEQLLHGFRPWGSAGASPSGDQSAPCNVDINCPVGDAWQDPKRGVVLMPMASANR